MFRNKKVCKDVQGRSSLLGFDQNRKGSRKARVKQASRRIDERGMEAADSI